MKKQEMRKTYKQLRNALTLEQVHTYSVCICDHICRWQGFRNADCILAYYPLGNEVDIRPLLEEAWKQGKRVAFPLVEGETMSFYEVRSFAELKEGYFGVMEPQAGQPVNWSDALVLVPGVVFNDRGGRMGFGKGFYDRYLDSHPYRATLGIGYGFQYCDELILEAHDVPLDYMVSEKGLHKASVEPKEIMSYETCMAFWKKTTTYGIQPGLTNISNLMEKLGNIQDQIPVVHIGGTNGKGSVGAFLNQVLVESGYKVGRFNTPGVFSFEEQFLMNGTPITSERWTKLVSKVAACCEELTAEGKPHPTSFEVDTATAFLWFYEEQVDVALVEVGMGGALDATNLIRKPIASVFVPVSIDHVKYLGETVEEIAAVKAGIIKSDSCAVIPRQQNSVVQVFAEKCETCNAKAYYYDSEVLPKDMELGLLGTFQRTNAACAYTTLTCVLQCVYDRITTETIYKGMKEARWPGRLEKVMDHPDVYLDGAHNEDAVRRLRDSLNLYFPEKRIVYIMGVLADKDFSHMSHIMFKAGDVVYAMTPPNPRALSAEKLAEQLRGMDVKAIACASIEDAVNGAYEEAGEQDMILAFGSLYSLGKVKEAISLRNRGNEHV